MKDRKEADHKMKSHDAFREEVFTSHFGDGPSKRGLTLEQLKQHNYRNDLWVGLYDKVYNLTDFYMDHPGGP